MTTLTHDHQLLAGSPAVVPRVVVAVAVVRTLQWREWIGQAQSVVTKMRQDFGDSPAAVRRAQQDLDEFKVALNPALELIDSAQQSSLSGPDDPTPSKPSGLAATIKQWFTAFRLAAIVIPAGLKIQLKKAAPQAAKAVESVAKATGLYKGPADDDPKVVGVKGIRSWLPPLPMIFAPGAALTWLSAKKIKGTLFPAFTSGNIGKGFAAFGAAALIGTLLVAVAAGVFALRWFAGSPAK